MMNETIEDRIVRTMRQMGEVYDGIPWIVTTRTHYWAPTWDRWFGGQRWYRRLTGESWVYSIYFNEFGGWERKLRFDASRFNQKRFITVEEWDR